MVSQHRVLQLLMFLKTNLLISWLFKYSIASGFFNRNRHESKLLPSLLAVFSFYWNVLKTDLHLHWHHYFALANRQLTTGGHYWPRWEAWIRKMLIIRILTHTHSIDQVINFQCVYKKNADYLNTNIEIVYKNEKVRQWVKCLGKLLHLFRSKLLKT